MAINFDINKKISDEKVNLRFGFGGVEDKKYQLFKAGKNLILYHSI